jgi:hypothetical protein
MPAAAEAAAAKQQQQQHTCLCLLFINSMELPQKVTISKEAEARAGIRKM